MLGVGALQLCTTGGRCRAAGACRQHMCHTGNGGVACKPSTGATQACGAGCLSCAQRAAYYSQCVQLASPAKVRIHTSTAMGPYTWPRKRARLLCSQRCASRMPACRLFSACRGGVDRVHSCRFLPWLGIEPAPAAARFLVPCMQPPASAHWPPASWSLVLVVVLGAAMR